MSETAEVTKVGPSELVELESPPGIRRRQAFARPGMWVGTATTLPGLASGWHHHDGHDTIVYVVSGRLAIEFGEGGERAVEAGAGDLLMIPSGVVHQEVTPSEGPAEIVLVRSGGDGPPTVEVEGPSP